MKFDSHKLILVTAMFITLGGCVQYGMHTRDINSFSISKENILNNIGSFDFERRMEILEEIDEIYKLYNDRKFPREFRRQVKIYPDRLSVETDGEEKTYLDLKLFDLDTDGTVDQFSYYYPDEKTTQEFGYVFDLNRDGKVDYIIFNGGVAFYEGNSIGTYNYHWIDSNYDGLIDIFVNNDFIDLNGDRFPERGIRAWIYDRDFDGFVDKAEYRGNDFVETVKENEGSYLIKYGYWDVKFVAKNGGAQGVSFKKNELPNKMFFDIHSVIQIPSANTAK